jgi:hypothetical protein
MPSKGIARPRFHRTARTLTASSAIGTALNTLRYEVGRRRAPITRDYTKGTELNSLPATITTERSRAWKAEQSRETRQPHDQLEEEQMAALRRPTAPPPTPSTARHTRKQATANIPVVKIHLQYDAFRKCNDAEAPPSFDLGN